MRALALLLALSLPTLGLAQEEPRWERQYRRADVLQTWGGRAFTLGVLSSAAGLAFFAPNHWDRGTKATNAIGRALVYTGVGTFVLAPPVMLGGALFGRGALRDAELFALTGPTGKFGSGRGGRLGVVAWVAAASTVPIALMTRDRFVFLGIVPLALSWVAAEWLILHNRDAWDELKGTDPTNLRIVVDIARFPF